MQTSRSRLIVDTNVLIDLHRGGVIEEFFKLPHEFTSPDVIIAELEDPAGSWLQALGLQSAELSGEQVLEVMSIIEHNQKVAANDIFAMLLAIHEQVALLTGDSRLRRLAENHKVEVHGTLWVLDEMVEEGILTPKQAAESLHLMVEKGSRLPPEECDRRFELWEGK